jgi:hypothetical protein
MYLIVARREGVTIFYSKILQMARTELMDSTSILADSPLATSTMVQLRSKN